LALETPCVAGVLVLAVLSDIVWRTIAIGISKGSLDTSGIVFTRIW